MIPYSVAMVMRWAWNSDAIKLSRPGFHDWSVYYDPHTKVPKLYNREYRVEFSEAKLVYFAQAMGHLSAVEMERDAMRREIEELQAENTKLREMFKSKAVTGELRDMQTRIDGLLKKINTADVIPFETARAA